MRSNSLARVVIASLGVSVVITLGCGKPQGGPSPVPSFSVLRISPPEGPTDWATIARVEGTGFQSGDTVTVDGSRVDATVLSTTTISLAMPAHVAGTVEVTVSRASSIGAQSLSVPGGYRYAVIPPPVPPPVISELLPNIGSTDGGVPIEIRGTGTGTMGAVGTVTVDGIIVSIDDNGWPYYEAIWLSTPAHAAGPVEVILTDRYGQAGSSVFTYASPATFDFNGDWQASAQGPRAAGAVLELTIRDNIVVSVSCSVCRNGVTCELVPSPTLDPPPVVANGEFSFAGSGGVSITGKILSPNYASGSINMPSCISSGRWTAGKK